MTKKQRAAMQAALDFAAGKEGIDAWRVVSLLRDALAQEESAEPVAFCQLTASGKIAYFDGMPMLMVGNVGNEHHPTPLSARPQPREPPTPDEIRAEFAREFPDAAVALDAVFMLRAFAWGVRFAERKIRGE